MIDPITSLASSMVASPGVYALLLGSGVSRSAGIPTGWEVTIDLIRRIAAAEGSETSPTSDVEITKWFRERYAEEPSYSNVLEHLALGAGDRRSLLSGYFERESEDPEGVKSPTRAHQAIARLASRGYVKVIVTTNFDRLLEDAMTAEGVTYQVISTPDSIEGAVPLSNAPVTILKLHGDYRDNRLRNTVNELDNYEPELADYLSRIFEEYGLVVCGWSGEWDRALVQALKSVASKRYGFYVTSRSEPTQVLSEMLASRGGRIIEIADADSFFGELAERIAAIEKLADRDPMTADLAEAALKRYLPRPEMRIELEDLIRVHLGDLSDRLARWNGTGRSLDTYLEELDELAQTSQVCLKLIIAGAYYGSDEHDRLWTLMIDRALNRPHLKRLESPEIHRLPAVLLAHGFVAGAVAGNSLEKIPRVLDPITIRVGNQSEPGYHAFRPGDGISTQILKEVLGISNREGMVADNRWVRKALRPHLTFLVPEGPEMDQLLDEAEYVLALLSSLRPAYGEIPGYPSMGAFAQGHPGAFWDTSNHVIGRYERRLRDEGEEFPLIRATGVSLDQFMAAKAKVDQIARDMSLSVL